MKPLRIVFLVITFFFLVVTLYYTVDVLMARSATEEIVYNALRSKKRKLSLSDFSDEQIDALLTIQDKNFYHHHGVDMTTPGTGVTTISQGLVKLYYFEEFKPGIQKIRQTLIARFAFDSMIPKDTILTLFINDVYMGQHDSAIHGFENAAQAYMNKSFKDVTWEEYLSLVAMIRAPETYHYVREPDANQHRVERIKKVLRGEYIPVDNADWRYDRY